jgi:hypothetical protein
MEKLFKCPRCRKGFDTYQIMDRHKKKCTGIEEIQETQSEIIERLKNELTETKTDNRKLRFRLEEEKKKRSKKTDESTITPNPDPNITVPTSPKQLMIRVKRTKTPKINPVATANKSTILDYLQTYCPDACDILDFIDQIVLPTNIKELFKERTYTNVMLDILERSWKTINNSRQKPMYRFPQSFMELPPTPQEVLYIHHEGCWMKESFPNIFITTTVGYKMLKHLDDRLLAIGVEYIKSSPNFKTHILGIFIENTLTPCTNVLIQDVILDYENRNRYRYKCIIHNNNYIIMIYIIITTSIINKIGQIDESHRKKRYMDSIQQLLTLIKHDASVHPIIVENNGERHTYLNELSCDICYTNNNIMNFHHKGMNELLDIKEVIHRYNIQDDDMIIKLTGRYKYRENS